jgi:predicted component of type VI protein secretion system
MSNDQLKNTLQDLHRHLESTDGKVDTELKSLLQTLDRDIHHLLNQDKNEETNTPSDEAPLGERAQELSARFAAQHPQLERLLVQLGNTLQSMGI